MRIVGQLESDYEPAATHRGADLALLEPTCTLETLSARVGRSVESYTRTWQILEAEDRAGGEGLRQSQLNVLIAALRDLPADGAYPAGAQSGEQGKQVRVASL